MKVYIITTGSYSDYSIDRVYIDEEKAKFYYENLSKCQQDVQLAEYDCGVDYEDLVSMRTWHSNIDLFSGEVKEAQSIWGDKYSDKECYEMVRPNSRVPSYQWGEHKIDLDYPDRTYSQMSVFRSYLSQEHANKLAIEFRQGWLRQLSELNLKMVTNTEFPSFRYFLLRKIES